MEAAAASAVTAAMPLGGGVTTAPHHQQLAKGQQAQLQAEPQQQHQQQHHRHHHHHHYRHEHHRYRQHHHHHHNHRAAGSSKQATSAGAAAVAAAATVPVANPHGTAVPTAVVAQHQHPHKHHTHATTSSQGQRRRSASSAAQSGASAGTTASKASSHRSSRRSSSTGRSARKEEPHEILEQYRTSRDGVTKSVVHRYLKTRLLGRGGFAKCYKFVGLDGHIRDRVFAGKVVARSSLKKSSAKEKIKAEIMIHRSLSHKHVVKFYSYFENSHSVYIVLELCPNQSLMELMRTRRRLSELEARYYMLQCLEAVRYLHANNIIHRDLKLGNLFLARDMGIKVGDFGLAAKLMHANERKRTICGTPNYIAPEILDGKKKGHSFEVDIWSLGVIMYTLLVGRPPFETQDVKATYRRIRANEYIFPDKVSISDHAKSLIRWILNTAPTARPGLLDIVKHPWFTAPGTYIPKHMPETALSKPYPFRADDLVSGSTRIAQFIAEKPEINAGLGGLTSKQRKLVAAQAAAQQKSAATVDAAATAAPHKAVSAASKAGQFGVKPDAVGAVDTRLPLASRQSNSAAAKATFARGASSAAGAGACVKAFPTSTAAPTSTRATAPLRAVNGVAKPVPIAKPSATVQASERQRERRTGWQEAATKPAAATSSNSENAKPVPASNSGAAPTVPAATTTRWASSRAAPEPAPTKTTATSTPPVLTQLAGLNHAATESAARSSATPTSTAATGAGASAGVGAGVGTSAPGSAHASAAAAPVAAKSSTTTAAAAAGGTTTKTGGTDTLKHMHDQLAQSFAVKPGDAVPGLGDCKPTASAATVHATAGDVASGGAAASSGAPAMGVGSWVVTWVDYTSKYGLGYMLSDGCVGVYFNDSTKIVLASDGVHFEYVERSSSTATAAQRRVIVRARHTLDSFPKAITKKVTLLNHFKGYLLDQFKASDAAACPQVIASMARGSVSRDMPFVKKFVKTRHAVLFRLTNSQVQVNFFDKTSLLLSSAARLVTFKDKAGARVTQPLATILASGRADVAKRLQYTKDILHQLITGTRR